MLFDVRLNFMITARNPLSLIIATQSVFIIGGSLVVGGLLKFHGYPDAPNVNFHPLAVFIRNWGLLGLIIPLSWVLVNYKIGKIHDDYEPGIIQSVIAIAFSLVLIIFYLMTAFGCAQHPTMSQNIAS